MVLYARYREAIQAARALLERGDLDARTRNAGLEVLAVAQIANRQRGDASETLAVLYARDPGHLLTDPDASPQIQSAFAQAREAAEPMMVELLHDAPGTLASRESPLISVQLGEGADTVDEMRLRYRAEGEERWSAVVMAIEGGSASGRIPLRVDSGAYDVHYYAEAAAPSRTVLAVLGSEAEPLELRVPAAAASALARTSSGARDDELPPDEEEGSSVLGAWWFWTAVVVVLGGGAAAYVLLGPPSEGPPDGSLGNVSLGLW